MRFYDGTIHMGLNKSCIIIFNYRRAVMSKGIFSVGAFAKYTRTTKDTLLHYDRIGLLSPAIRGDNSYRYYAPNQLALVNVIRTLQQVGLSLQEIKELMDDRNPENFDVTFEQQMKKIDEKIIELCDAKHLLRKLHSNIKVGLGVDEEAISVEFLKKEKMIMGGINDYSNEQDDFDALNVFYRKVHEKYPKLNLNYPVWGAFSKERIRNRDWKYPDRFYFYHPKGDEYRPESLYVIGYTRGGYGNCGELYERLMDFIDENEYEISGDSFEEYVLNEISVVNDQNYLIRIMIAVTKK